MSEPPRKPWHAFLAPLPPDAVPRRKPVASPELAATTDVSAIAGWDDLLLDLVDPPFGLRMVHVVVDADDHPISASDHVLFQFPADDPDEKSAPARIRQESLGGRIEADGTFNGTHWDVSGFEQTDEEENPPWDAAKRPPTAAETAALLALVAEMLKRAPSRSRSDS